MKTTTRPVVRVKQLVYDDELDDPELSSVRSDALRDVQYVAASARSSLAGGPVLSADERELCAHYKEELLEAKRAGEFRFVLDLPPRHALLFLYQVWRLLFTINAC